MGSFLKDCRYALRQLLKSPGFTAAAILTLAFGLGATTAIFSIFEGVLLRPLPFPKPGALVFLGDILEGVQHDESAAPSVTAPGALIYMHDTHVFSGLGAYRTTTYEFSNGRKPAQINAARLTAGIFPTLGISPMVGRVFNEEEEKTGEPVTVLSYQTWKNRFHADPQILQRKVLLDRRPYQVIGVMPRNFEFPLVPGHLNRCELWVPMNFRNSELIQGAGNWGYYLVGRLKPGVTAEEAEQDAIPASREIMRSFPPALSNRHLRPGVRGLDEITVVQARALIHTLFLAVLVVLFIASANLAALLLLRVMRRHREISVRMALGASRMAILQQTVSEALLLSVMGGLLGLVLAAISLRMGVSFLPETLPRIDSIRLDWGVVALTLAAAILTGLFCGLVPGLSISRNKISEALKEGGRTGTTGAAHARLRSGLVIAEVAVALVLLTASGLLLRSFQKMRAVDLGFTAEHTLTASYNLPRQQYSTQAAVDTFNRTLRDRLEALPAVQEMGITTLLPAAGTQYLATFTPEGYVAPKPGRLNIGWIPEVSGNYFAAQGIRIIRGRSFTESDNADAPLVAIVNRSLAQHYWAGKDPIGKRLHRGPAEAKLPWLTIVGEIEGVKQMADQTADYQIYVPSGQVKSTVGSFASPDMLVENGGSIVLRTSLPPERMADSLRAVVHSIDPELPVTSVESMDSVISEGQAPRRFNTALISAFAGTAVLLALLGIYSVVAFSTAMRTHEMAIRLALGSQRSSLMRLILTSAGKLGLTGCVIGLAGTIFSMRLLRSLLFEVDPLDPAVLVLAAVSILLLAIGAAMIPARRAVLIDPIVALRTE